MSPTILRKKGIAALLSLCVLISVPTLSHAKLCLCRKIGGSSFCVPDPDCLSAEPGADVKFHKSVTQFDTSKSIEKSAQDAGKVVAKLKILDTGYSQLLGFGMEEPGYGLYSYAILASDSGRSSAFLAEIFKSVHGIDDTAQRSQLNIFYIPTKQELSSDFINASFSLATQPDELGAKFSRSFYDYKISRSILNHICNPPADIIRETCQGDMSQGPYIFTYSKPASSLEPVPPPFLFVDLSSIDVRAFGEFVSALKAQVKRDDISDGARINSLRLKILNIALKASDYVGPARKAVGDIVHSSQ